MKTWKTRLSSALGGQSHQATRGGSYSLAMTALVLAVLIVVNLLVSALPTSLTRYDISASKLYSITSNTKVVVNALEEDVTIYWIVQSGEENQVIENLLDKYASLSDHISMVKKNPDVYPTFAQQYTDEAVQNNSLVVECGEKYRYIGYEDIYLGELNFYTGTYSADRFDGEGAITSALDYVTREEYPQIYLLEGHGESSLPASLAEQIEKENMQTQPLSLLTVDEIPADAACVMIYAPSSDLSSQEVDMLADYVQSGGKLWVCAGPTEDGTLENLCALLQNYGVTAEEGIVVEADREHYALGAPLLLIPTLESSSVTDSLLAENYSVILPIAQPLAVDFSASGVTPLLTTSSSAFSKVAGYDLTTYDFESGDLSGPFATAVAIEDASGGQIYWFSSDRFLEEQYNSFSSGANLDLAMNTLSDLVGESEAMSIRTKSLNYNYLTISSGVASLLKVLMVGVFPLGYLTVGIAVILKRKKAQHETV